MYALDSFCGQNPAEQNANGFLPGWGSRTFEKRASVKLHSVFLRKQCVLPDRLDPFREPIGNSWERVEEILAPVFDTMIRQAGWHFMWVLPPCARRGLGITADAAIGRALTRALRGVAIRFTAAELDSVRVRKYLGFYIANVTLQSRQIQEHTSLEDVDQRHPCMLAAM